LPFGFGGDVVRNKSIRFAPSFLRFVFGAVPVRQQKTGVDCAILAVALACPCAADSVRSFVFCCLVSGGARSLVPKTQRAGGHYVMVPTAADAIDSSFPENSGSPQKFARCAFAR
jgi:hypothetical protein